MNTPMSSDFGDHAIAERVRETSPAFKARIAGVLYMLSVVTAVFSEFFSRDGLGLFAGVAVPLACYLAVMVLLFAILKPVNRSLCLLAVSFGVAGLGFEAPRLQPAGVNLGMVFHGFYCLLIGYLVFRSTFLPRVLGV